MSSPYGRLLLIANPLAGRGRAAVLPRLQAALDAEGIAHRTVVTRARGHATELAHDAATGDETRLVVAVGGDGTVNEVVNGLVDPDSGRPHADDAVLGIVVGGTGGDLARTFGLDRSPERLARHLAGASTIPMDLGRVRYVDEHGAEAVRLFANIAQCGWGAEVVRRTESMPSWLRTARYPVAIVGSSWSSRLVPATVTIDHTSITEPITEVVVANGQFFGGGLKIAPRALPDDGSYNVQTWRLTPTDILRNLQRARVGEHLTHPSVREYQSSTVGVRAEEPMLVEADGEVFGTTPATFDILDRAVSLKI